MGWSTEIQCDIVSDVDVNLVTMSIGDEHPMYDVPSVTATTTAATAANSLSKRAIPIEREKQQEQEPVILSVHHGGRSVEVFSEVKEKVYLSSSFVLQVVEDSLPYGALGRDVEGDFKSVVQVSKSLAEASSSAVVVPTGSETGSEEDDEQQQQQQQDQEELEEKVVLQEKQAVATAVGTEGEEDRPALLIEYIHRPLSMSRLREMVSDAAAGNGARDYNNNNETVSMVLRVFLGLKNIEEATEEPEEEEQLDSLRNHIFWDNVFTVKRRQRCYYKNGDFAFEPFKDPETATLLFVIFCSALEVALIVYFLYRCRCGCARDSDASESHGHGMHYNMSGSANKRPGLLSRLKSLLCCPFYYAYYILCLCFCGYCKRNKKKNVKI